jgi:outer membrane usher protein
LQIRRASIYTTAFKDISETTSGRNSGMQFGVTVPFGRRSSVNVSATTDGNGQLQAQKSAALIGEWGYDAFVSAGNSNHAFGQVQYKSPVGMFTAGLDQTADATTLRLESQGAFSFVDRGFFASNTIYDSFAIVDTNPIPHVHVLQENRNVGSTSSSGRLLVPDMRSFDLNHIAIAATDIPPDVTIDMATREMRPQDRSGVVVKFPVKISHGALLKLVDEVGVPMPIGTSVTLRSTGVSFPVGYDGDAYLEDLGSHNELIVESVDGKRCSISFDYKPVEGEIPLIGPLRCAPRKP